MHETDGEATNCSCVSCFKVSRRGGDEADLETSQSLVFCKSWELLKWKESKIDHIRFR
jgi:hypothetical protein